jgi:hypothetical protein
MRNAAREWVRQAEADYQVAADSSGSNLDDSDSTLTRHRHAVFGRRR